MQPVHTNFCPADHPRCDLIRTRDLTNCPERYAQFVRGLIAFFRRRYDYDRDVVVEAICTAIAKALAKEQDTITNLRAWVITVARNEACDIAKRQGRNKGADALAGVAAPSDHSPERNELIAAVQAVIAELPVEERGLIFLRVNADMTYAEIAALLKMGEAYVARRRVRALFAKLAVLLAAYGPRN